MQIPDFSPYDVPFDIPINGPMQCQLCKRGVVDHIAQMSYGDSVPHVFFGCTQCVNRWVDGPIRPVTYNGLTSEEALEARRKQLEDG